ncbi:hypothetical protein FZEAL_4825 [Fusarium zealandicum]|uniref:Uncharacterized protein n=1 Tax=Fusarium zealandicum TaxID=1053134 RepID=A0A8H4ULM7_9HYPO|nr:hypothetical protein FZEAL_4825 [Fusarium zealandicum]
MTYHIFMYFVHCQHTLRLSHQASASDDELSRELHENPKHRLGANFFFGRGRGDIASAKDFAVTISYQLENISKPLQELIQKVTALSNVEIRAFVTSRPDTPLIHGFKGISEGCHRQFVLHDIEMTIIDQDIQAYYNDQFSKLDLIETNKSSSVVKRLVERSHGLFIHAATICRFIKGGKMFADRRLSCLLENNASGSNAETVLDVVYPEVLIPSLSGNFDPDEREELRQYLNFIVGSIVTLYDTTCLPDLAKMLAQPEQRIRAIVDRLHPVLDVPLPGDTIRVIRLVHPSFRDFLLDNKRNPSPMFSIDAPAAHGFLLAQCFEMMRTHLRKNICSIQQPGTRVSGVSKVEVDQHIPGPVHYLLPATTSMS